MIDFFSPLECTRAVIANVPVIFLISVFFFCKHGDLHKYILSINVAFSLHFYCNAVMKTYFSCNKPGSNSQWLNKLIIIITHTHTHTEVSLAVTMSQCCVIVGTPVSHVGHFKNTTSSDRNTIIFVGVRL